MSSRIEGNTVYLDVNNLGNFPDVQTALDAVPEGGTLELQSDYITNTSIRHRGSELTIT